MSKGSWKEFDQDQNKPRSNNLSKSFLPLKRDQKIRVQKTSSGRKGKVVTEINGLQLESSAGKELLKTLKSICGTGGTFKENSFELQGDQVEIVIEILRKKGYMPKRSGG